MSKKIFLRDATLEDARVIFELFNDESVRKNAKNPEQITLEEHIAWFKNKIHSKTTKIFIAYNSKQEFLGNIRFDLEEKFKIQGKENWIISISVVKAMRGQGFASEMLEKACKKANIINALAYVKEDNIISQKTFIRAGFNKIGLKMMNNNTFIVFNK